MAEEVLQTTFKVNTALIKLLKSRVHRNNSNSILQDFKLSRPDQPSAIFWQNIGVPTSNVRRARLISFTATILLIATSLLILIFLKRIQITVIPPVENDMFTFANLKPWTISVIMMFVVVIINSSLAYTLRILNGKEHYETTNAYMPALTIKIAMAQFINSNLLIVLTHVLVQVPNGIKIYARNGLLFDAWTLLLGEALVPPLLLCCNPLRIYSWLCRICIRLKARTCFGKLMTQREVNSVYEKSVFDPAMAYSNLIRIILMSFFLQPMFPSSIFIATVSFAVIYWVEKYSLLRHSAKTVTIDAGLCHQTLYLLNHAGLVYGLSQIIFDISFYGRIFPASMLILVIGSVLCVVPAQKLLELLGACCLKLTDRGNRTRVSQIHSKPRQDKFSEQYELARETFNSEYDRSNPITSPESNREYFKYMVQRMDSSKIIKLADSLLLQNIQRNLDQNQYFGNPERHQFTRPQPMYDFKNHLDKDPHFFEIIANISGAVDDIFSNSNRPQTKELPGYIVNYFCQNQMLSVDSLTNNLLAVLSRKYRNKKSTQQAGNDLQQAHGNPLGQGRTNQPSHTVRLPVDHLDQDGEGDLGSTNRDLQGMSKKITPRVLVPTPSRRLPGLFDRNQNSKRSLLSAGPELGLLSSRVLPSPTSANFTTIQGRNLASEAGTPNASVSTSKNQVPVILKARSPSRVSIQIKKVSQPKSGQGFRDLAESDLAQPKEMTPKAKLVPPKIIGSQR